MGDGRGTHRGRRRRRGAGAQVEDLADEELDFGVLKVVEGGRADTALGRMLTGPLTGVGDAEDGFHAELHTLGEGERLDTLDDGDIRRDEVQLADTVLVIDGDFFDRLDLELLEFADGELLDAVEAPPGSEAEDAEPGFEGSLVDGVFSVGNINIHGWTDGTKLTYGL